MLFTLIDSCRKRSKITIKIRERVFKHYHFTGPMTSAIDGLVTLVGLKSYPNECSTPSIYSRVSSALDWIFENSDAGLYQCHGGKSSLFRETVNCLPHITLSLGHLTFSCSSSKDHFGNLILPITRIDTRSKLQ